MFKLVVLSIVVACVYAGVAPKTPAAKTEVKPEVPSVKSTPLHQEQQHETKKSEDVKSVKSPEVKSSHEQHHHDSKEKSAQKAQPIQSGEHHQVKSVKDEKKDDKVHQVKPVHGH
ncbi:uncharacterized protein LOC115891780 [Sitophilus oryzae]|uniref:Uncharacterized protein LOC115891780 n=1 Tax=Sitophilus oryzae TaxID=7048 RepID=A0A6J2YY82_SITOR|nr:uncharacterized protein LOC115891780 [Sitophilus oryzae]